jgi:RNA polymerase primary sigma factor
MRREDSLAIYLREAQKVPLMSPEEERACARAAAAGDAAARQRLVQANLRFVVRVARQHANRGLPLEDLVNEGNIGLLHAANRFDPERGVRFISYAVWWIRQGMVRALQPERAASAAVSLESPAGSPEDETPLWARLEDTSVPHPEEALAGHALKSGVDSALGALSGREQSILRERFGLSGSGTVTLAETGKRFGLSKERIRQIEKRALGKLRRSSGARELALACSA